MFGFGKKKKDESSQEAPLENKHVEHEKEVVSHHAESEEEKHPASSKKITRDTMIGEAAVMCPDAPEIMLSFGLHCIGCGMTAYETIEQGCMGHGMPEDIIDKLVEELNEAFVAYEKEAQKHIKH